MGEIPTAPGFEIYHRPNTPNIPRRGVLTGSILLAAAATTGASRAAAAELSTDPIYKPKEPETPFPYVSNEPLSYGMRHVSYDKDKQRGRVIVSMAENVPEILKNQPEDEKLKVPTAADKLLVPDHSLAVYTWGVYDPQNERPVSFQITIGEPEQEYGFGRAHWLTEDVANTIGHLVLVLDRKVVTDFAAFDRELNLLPVTYRPYTF